MATEVDYYELLEVQKSCDDGTLKTPQVVMRVSNDGGASFGDAIAVSDSGAAATFPVLALSNRNVTVVWAEQSQEAAEHAEHSRPDMKDPESVMGLPTVGMSQVFMRTGSIR